jgi:hypothetical protein
MGDRSSKSFLSEAAEDLLRGPVMLGQAIKYTASGLREKSKARDEETALKKARQKLDEQRPQSKGSVGRESAGKQRDRDARVLIRAGAADKK